MFLNYGAKICKKFQKFMATILANSKCTSGIESKKCHAKMKQISKTYYRYDTLNLFVYTRIHCEIGNIKRKDVLLINKCDLYFA